MKNILVSILLAGLLLLSGCGQAAPPEDKTLRILATTYPAYLFTTALTGGADGVEVSLLVNSQTSCLHDYTLTADNMKAIEKADIIIKNGAGLETFLENALSGSRAEIIDCSEGIDLLPAPNHAEHDGHDHEEEYDPHFWMDMDSASRILEHIAQELETLADIQCQDNCSLAKASLSIADETWSQFFSNYSNVSLVTFHNGFQYLAQRYGLNLLKAVEEEDGSTVSAQTIKEITSLVHEHDIPAIFVEKNGSAATAKVIARETGCQVYTLDMLMSGNGTGIQPYLDAMTANLNTIREALL